ncbi:MAG: CHAT domain-containing protein, partial [Rhodospirillaceae bacterium]
VPFRSVASRLVKGLKAENRDRIELTVLRPPTLSQLEITLEAAKTANKPFHLVHFDGHGVFDSKAVLDMPRGYVSFEDPKAESHKKLVDGRTLGALLHRHGIAGLVLNACQSADAGEQKSADQAEQAANQADLVQAQGSLAQELVDAGLGAVLAMRYSVYVVTVAEYVGRFYELLAGGRSFGTAATEARKTLHTQPIREIAGMSIPFQDWPVPVVFEANPLPLLKAVKDAKLFKLNGTAGGTNDELPPPPDIGFIGRDASLLELDRAFDEYHIVLLHALAGSGKTTTAIEFARWYRDTHGIEGPIWFDSFQDHLPLARLLDKIETAFAPVLQHNNINWVALDHAGRVAITLQILSQTPVLWIWDNVEEVGGFPAGSESRWSKAEQKELHDFLARLKDTKAKVLLTSRRDERVWLGDLPVKVRPGAMPMPERAQMAAALAKRHGRDKAALPALKPLLEWTQGNPMTLTVVIGQALRDHCTTGEQVARYLERLRAGEAGFHDDTEQGRSKSLGASLAYGFKQAFTAEERALLSLLHLFQGLVDADVLVAMGHENNPGRAAPYAGRDQAFWLDLLNRAVEIGLLTGRGGEYFSIHPALPWFLKQGFEAAFGPAAAAPPPLRAWVEAIGGLSNHWATRYIHGDHGALTPLQAQEANLLQSRALALRHGWLDPVISAMQGLRAVHQASGRWAAWEELVTEIFPLVEDPESGEPLPGREPQWSITIEYRVELAEQRRDPAAGLALLEKMIVVNRRIAGLALAADPAALTAIQRNQIRTLAASLQQLGSALIEADDRACVDALKEAKVLDERVELQREAAIAAFNLGHAYKDVTALRDLDLAEAAYRESLGLHSEDDRSGRAKCHGQLGYVSWERFEEARRAKAEPATLQKHLAAALKGYQTALGLAPESEHAGRAVAHNQLGLIYERVRKTDQAATHYLDAIRHQEASGNPYGAAQTCWNLADLYRVAGRFADARDYAGAALKTFESFDGRAADMVEKTKLLIALIEQCNTTP